MAGRLEFTIAVKPFGEAAKKDVAKFTGQLRASDDAIARLNKTLAGTLKSAKRSFEDISQVAGRSTNVIADGISKAIGVVDKLNDRLIRGTKHAFEKVKEHARDAFKETTIGALRRGGERAFDFVLELPKRLFEAGSGDIRARQRLKREFGAEGGYMQDIATRVGKRAGLDDSDALTALFAVGEAVSGTTAGTMFRGKKLSEADARKLREQTFGFGAKLFERVATITGASGEEANQLGYLLANAGAGPEGMRGLVSALHLNKAISSQILKANEKGKLYEYLGAEGSKKFGVQKGQVAGQGTMIDLLLQRSGFTEEAAAEERKKFGYQVKSIGATFEGALGDIGSTVLDKITGGFAKGTTLAEKFQQALESDKGKKTIEGIANGITSAAEAAVALAKKLPEVFGFIERHKGLLGVLAGGYAAASVAKPILGALGAVRGSTPLTPLFVSVTNGMPGAGGAAGMAGKAGLVVGAGLAGYALGTYLDQKFALSDRISGVRNIKAKDDSEFAKDEALRAIRSEAVVGLPPEIREKYRQMIYKATPLGTDLEEAKRRVSGILGSEQLSKDVQSVQVTSVIQLDGRTIARVVNDHNVNQVKASTGGIPR